jgi:hypothetical protein
MHHMTSIRGQNRKTNRVSAPGCSSISYTQGSMGIHNSHRWSGQRIVKRMEAGLPGSNPPGYRRCQIHFDPALVT